jgi:hypothetical protein
MRKVATICRMDAIDPYTIELYADLLRTDSTCGLDVDSCGGASPSRVHSWCSLTSHQYADDLCGGAPCSTRVGDEELDLLRSSWANCSGIHDLSTGCRASHDAHRPSKGVPNSAKSTLLGSGAAMYLYQ